MAGHSKFKNIMHRKSAQDNKRGKLFTRLVRDIFVAAKNGLPDVDANARLRIAINAARAANMPKERIDNAIAKATNPHDNSNYEEIRYEGYGPHGVAIIVEALTDNRNRTASDVRSVFNKYGGSLGETGSVSFMFRKLGLISYPDTITAYDDMLENCIEVGAEDCLHEDGHYLCLCIPEQLNTLTQSLASKFGEAIESQVVWRPISMSTINAEMREKINNMVEALEESDDVQEVFTNA